MDFAYVHYSLWYNNKYVKFEFAGDEQIILHAPTSINNQINTNTFIEGTLATEIDCNIK